MLDLCFDCVRNMFQVGLTYVSTGLDQNSVCFDYNLGFDFHGQNWLCFDFVLDLKSLFDCGFSVEQLHLLDF